MNPGSSTPSVSYQPCDFGQATQLWSLSFLLCKMGLIVIPGSEGYADNVNKVPGIQPSEMIAVTIADSCGLIWSFSESGLGQQHILSL